MENLKEMNKRHQAEREELNAELKAAEKHTNKKRPAKKIIQKDEIEMCQGLSKDKNMTGGIGSIEMSCKEIVKLFGKPASVDTSGYGKTSCEWNGYINGAFFPIYDYKAECNYKKNTDWHFGGHYACIFTALQNHINSELKK